MSDYQKPTFDFFGEESQGRKNKRMSKQQEKNVSKTGSKGKLTPGSGNKGIKGDVWKLASNPFFKGRMYEAKVTENKSIKVDSAYLVKLTHEALAAQKEPVFVFGFHIDTLREKDWGAVPLARLEELFEVERKYYERMDRDEA